LSLLGNEKTTFEGRKVGVVVGDGADAAAVKRVTSGVKKVGGDVEIIAMAVGGATLSDDSTLEADQAIAGAPSVLYDAVAIIAGADGGLALANEPTARDFLTDAFAHFKVIGLGGQTETLVATCGLDGKLDDACLSIDTPKDAKAFLERIAGPRQWERNLDA